jgi:Ca-activated chloride channel family protein
MSFQYPVMVALAAVVGAGLLLAYRWLHRQRANALAAAGLRTSSGTSWANVRRHLPPLLFVAALIVLLFSAARPQATVPVPRAAGTVVLAFDISNSMSSKDVAPSRLAIAKDAAIEFVEAQPDSVDFGVVAFGSGALITQQPSNDRAATIAAIKRLAVAGSTSLGHAILVSLTAITGEGVTLPDPDAAAPPPDLGYWGSATIVIISDGVEESGGGPGRYVDPVAAAELAASAGVHIETIGVGTVKGSVIEVEGFQLATTLDEGMLKEIAESTNGSYHRAEDAQALGSIYQSIDLRITIEDKLVELTAAGVIIGLLLLTVGGILMINWFGRIV